MLPLYALGLLEQYGTFVQLLKKDRDTLRLASKYDPYSDHVPTNYVFFRKHKPSLLPWLRAAALFGTLRFWLLRLIPGFIKTRLQRYGYFIDPFKAEYAFNNPEIIQALEAQQNKS